MSHCLQIWALDYSSQAVTADLVYNGRALWGIGNTVTTILMDKSGKVSPVAMETCHVVL